MLLEAVIVINICLVITWLINRWIFRNFINLAYQLPCNRWHRFLGFGPVIKRKVLISTLYDCDMKYGENSMIWSGPFPIYRTSDPETIKDILSSKMCINKPHLIMKGITYTLGIGLLSCNEPTWSRHRKVINKAFSHKNLLTFLPIFNEDANDLITQINTKLLKGNNIDMLKEFRQFTLKISSKTMLQRNLDQTQFDSLILVDYLNKILDCSAGNCLTFYWNFTWLRKLTKIFKFKDALQGVKIYKNLISESWNILKKNKNNNDTSYLPEQNSVLKDILKGVQENIMEEHEVDSEMLHMLLASFETSSSLLYYVLILLAIYPEYQERVYEEIHSILPTNNDDLSLKHIDQLNYLEMVLNETMRIMPLVSTVIREVSNENVKLNNGVTLSVGQMVVIDIFSLHRSKKVWGPNAASFNPDNFLPSNVAHRHPYSFIPFTKGQRFCVGWRYGILSAKISLVKLIKTYKFTTDFKFENLKLENHISSKLIEEPQLYLERRDINK